MKMSRIAFIKGRQFKYRVASALVALILILVPIFLYITDIEPSSGRYSIDGNFNDWDKSIVYLDTSSVFNTNVDIKSYNIAQEDEKFEEQVKNEFWPAIRA